MAKANTPTPIRCAIYTRKSTDEGLNQDFNSLDAQREAADAYIKSQVGEGWRALPELYDDGGYTGANMDRPALKRLMADVEAKRIDCVVVYKVDRLSRSIRDFAKMMEIFENHDVCFVSVTQQFNTTSSLGRLTLNILLSFAQFEREIISERTRDKHVAARKKGKWMGGPLVLGYDLDPRGGRLVLNPDEAERVRQIFSWYLEGESVQKIVQKAKRRGWRNKQWTTREGKPCGGRPLGKPHIYKMLANVLYTGRMKVDGEMYPAEHEAIIDERTFDLVQEKLKQNARVGEGGPRRKTAALLRGLLYCSCCGSAMYPTYSISRNRQYRYYVCVRAKQGCKTRPMSAPAVEEAVVESIRRFAVAPEVLQEAARALWQRADEDVRRLRGELKEANATVKNRNSQLTRMRTADAKREARLREEITAAEPRVEALRAEIARLERYRLDKKDLRAQATRFDDLWKVMNFDEQVRFLRVLVEKVGCDSRTGKVRVSFKSTGIKEVCEKGAA